MTEIIMKAYDVLEEILQDDKIHQLKVLDKEIESKYHADLKAFEQMKQIYNQVLNEGGAYHPDYAATLKTFSEMKKALYEKEEVARYLQIERKLEQELNAFLNDIAQIVSHYIPRPNPFGLFKKGGNHHAHESH
ncbi:MAG: hypothetical protein WC225_05215 [Acholeplasmataceae bacterium]|nr:hypothetical protein [Acholeplasmataceae bacterium]